MAKQADGYARQLVVLFGGMFLLWVLLAAAFAILQGRAIRSAREKFDASAPTNASDQPQRRQVIVDEESDQ